MEGNWTLSGGNGEGNKYGYNGKELNDDFGLGWNHHDWRFLDVAINRWVTVDPLGEDVILDLQQIINQSTDAARMRSATAYVVS